MSQIEIEYNLEQVRMLYREYFCFYLKESLKNYAVVPLSLAGLLAIGYGWIREHDLSFGIGSTLLLLIFGICLYFLIKSQFLLKKLNLFLDTQPLKTGDVFQFAFDENKLTYIFSDKEYEIKWEEIRKALVHKTSIYLFDEKRQLREIIDKRIMGEHQFNQFFEIVKSKNLIK